MKLAYIAHHLPEPDGTAAGRQLWAICSALVEQGHEVTVRSWRPDPPTADLPAWCEWRPLPDESWWRSRARSLVQPRADVVRAGFVAPDDAVVIADDPFSWQAAAGQGRQAVVTVHFSTALDRSALGWTAADVQDLRGERRAVRQAARVWSLSERVGAAVGRGTFVPPSIPLPVDPLPVVEAPVVGLLADWSWQPNVLAAQQLVSGWSRVRAAVPGAQLLLAGRGPSPVGTLEGVCWLGEVGSSADLLSRTAVFAFPCPPTSGPKMKVMDAFGHGVAVLTTPAGVEGLVGGTDAAAVLDEADVVPRLVGLLQDPGERARLAAAGRARMVESHAPSVAARVRIQALAGALL